MSELLFNDFLCGIREEQDYRTTVPDPDLAPLMGVTPEQAVFRYQDVSRLMADPVRVYPKCMLNGLEEGLTVMYAFEPVETARDLNTGQYVANVMHMKTTYVPAGVENAYVSGTGGRLFPGSCLIGHDGKPYITVCLKFCNSPRRILIPHFSNVYHVSAVRCEVKEPGLPDRSVMLTRVLSGGNTTRMCTGRTDRGAVLEGRFNHDLRLDPQILPPYVSLDLRLDHRDDPAYYFNAMGKIHPHFLPVFTAEFLSGDTQGSNLIERMIQDIDLHDALLAYNTRDALTMYHSEGFFGFVRTYLEQRLPDADLTGVHAYLASADKPFADRLAALVKSGYGGRISSEVYAIYMEKLASVLISLATS